MSREPASRVCAGAWRAPCAAPLPSLGAFCSCEACAGLPEPSGAAPVRCQCSRAPVACSHSRSGPRQTGVVRVRPAGVLSGPGWPPYWWLGPVAARGSLGISVGCTMLRGCGHCATQWPPGLLLDCLWNTPQRRQRLSLRHCFSQASLRLAWSEGGRGLPELEPAGLFRLAPRLRSPALRAS